jgi:hypothetical protein
MIITVKRPAHRHWAAMQFFAQADKQTNQKVLPIHPVGGEDAARSPVNLCPRDQPLSISG